ncbi:hypothetical protein [Sorangium sp. So ce117]|uniref:hypothetical protein n=1 Tax=Sorangium sp. So ce117 TaxID=3133277 RepID=UPI003F613CED
MRRLDELHEADATVKAVLAALVNRLVTHSGALGQKAGLPASPIAHTRVAFEVAFERESRQSHGTTR